MQKPVFRLQSQGVQDALDAVDDLRGQALADADYNRKLGVLRWMVQRQILATYGQAMSVYSGQWQALERQHREQNAAFERREASVMGRIINLAGTIPTESYAAAIDHVREGMLSSECRQNALVVIQKRERDDLALRQRRYREWLCKPNQHVLVVLSQTAGQQSDKAEHGNDPKNFQEVLLRRARASIAKEIARGLCNEPTIQDGRLARHERPLFAQRKSEQDME